MNFAQEVLLNQDLILWEEIGKQSLTDPNSVKEQALELLNPVLEVIKEGCKDKVPEELLGSYIGALVMQNAGSNPDPHMQRLMSVITVFLHQYTDYLPLTEESIEALKEAKANGLIN